MFKYIFKGNSYTDISLSFMKNLGMTKVQQDSVLQQHKFECQQVSDIRREAFINESDSLYFEYQTAVVENDPAADTLKQKWLEKKAEIKARFPHIPS